MKICETNNKKLVPFEHFIRFQNDNIDIKNLLFLSSAGYALRQGPWEGLKRFLIVGEGEKSCKETRAIEEEILRKFPRVFSGW
jgi:hypothetical protein